MPDIQELLKKYESELRVVGDQKMGDGATFFSRPVRNTPITARENYLRTARRENPMWIPMELDEVMLTPIIFPDNIARNFVIDNVGITEEQAGGKDMFGIEWVYVPQAGGSMVRPGDPAVKDISHWEDYVTKPDIDSWDWEGSAKVNAPLISNYFPMNTWIFTGFFERLISFMDFESAALALIDEDQQEHVHRLFSYLADLYNRIIDRAAKSFNLSVIYFHDDWGSQRSPFFSLETCEEMIVPYLKRVVDHVHELGLIFNFHSCGCINMLVPAMIKAGVDIWSGQPMNDFEGNYEKYGKEITLGIYCMPPEEGAPMEEIEAFCKDFLDKYTGNGIAIPSPYNTPDPRVAEVLYCMSRELLS